MCGIGEILCIIGGKYNETLHSTYAQSTGFYKINNDSFFYKKIFSNKIVKGKKNIIGTIFFKNEKKIFMVDMVICRLLLPEQKLKIMKF